MKHDSFLYCWTDSSTNKLYVGKHKGDVNDGYISSSKYLLEEYNKRPNDFSRQIIAHGNNKDISELERIILTNENASNSEIYYNMHNGSNKFVCVSHTGETKLKIKNKAIGRKQPKSHRDKRRMYMLDPKIQRYMQEKQSSPDVRAKMSALKQGLYDGGNNPNAKRVKYNCKEYSTMKEMSSETNLSLYKIRMMIKNKEVEII